MILMNAVITAFDAETGQPRSTHSFIEDTTEYVRINYYDLFYYASIITENKTMLEKISKGGTK